jgi:hypothetical protein
LRVKKLLEDEKEVDVQCEISESRVKYPVLERYAMLWHIGEGLGRSTRGSNTTTKKHLEVETLPLPLQCAYKHIELNKIIVSMTQLQE